MHSHNHSHLPPGVRKTFPADSDSNSSQKVPDHHKPGGGFRNPWPSFEAHGFGEAFSLFALGNDYDSRRAAPPPPEERVPVIKPSFADIASFHDRAKKGDAKVRATWLGHACLFVQVGGVNVLADPCCSERCSPVQWAGPARHRPLPCDLADLPQIDVVLISHNHYDHLDLPTIQRLAKLPIGSQTTYFVPLGNKRWFEKSAPNVKVVEGDWWDEWEFSKSTATGAQVGAAEEEKVTVACTPCQHFSSRSIWDRDATLWSSWVVKSPNASFFFGGDTGYRAVPRSWPDPYAELSKLPHCPAFKQIGDKYGPFDLAAVPIGAYSPRWFMSPIHCSPEDSVELHRDIRARKSVGMHWGTFTLTDEPYWEPPQRLKAALAAHGMPEDEFVVLDIGGAVEV
ncbi:Metallo-hydrolase/oxidoreductase [Gonapodya prolifera JEL478]|uniref:Metallo-hydrolase/oxidoreductase n=1 Tax=Gonapodya prolifera (strain JEL478) TaxID=1344416 RepID=A0A139A880_GONPJ|nr:Metallo-hydrolase/oxidoreductase [Gonapodya prolifera JEL478]|eukprot:KXS12909.1 Metallo-hydrolase/oxidoreductase [Gonapodya prolifera JEL478]